MRAISRWYLCVLWVLGGVHMGQADSMFYPHQPFRWVFRHFDSDKVIRETITAGSPSFTFSLREVFPSHLGFPGMGETTLHQTYWCPASNPGKRYCEHPGYGYCGYWGCETIVMSDRWKPEQKDQFLQIRYAPNGCQEPRFAVDNSRFRRPVRRQRTCTRYTMTVLQPTHKSWTIGRVWSAFIRADGVRDRWVNVQIIRFLVSVPISLGTNLVPAPGESIVITTSLAPRTPAFGVTPMVSQPPTQNLASHNPFLKVLDSTFLSLNQSNPNLTESCWLCYDAKPPFYEGVALNVPFNYSLALNPPQCRWNTPRRGITLNQITGQVKCFGNTTLAASKSTVCADFVQPQRFDKWAIPSGVGMWVCHQSGVTPCIHLKQFDPRNDFCVQVLIVPRVLYHREDEIYRFSEGSHQIYKREIVTGITIAMLLGLGAAGTATGASALMTQHRGLSQLQATIDEDLQRIEESISSLEKSVSSLSEVVLQNRRGLDLLFMRQGGLCAALGEECCFYADHTGIVRDSMAELRDRLAQRKTEREAQRGWYESWFHKSPWLATLVSTLVGPLTMCLLVLAFGPCILNKLAAFVKKRLESVNILYVERRQML